MHSDLFVETKTAHFIGIGVSDYQKEELRFKKKHYCMIDNEKDIIYTTVQPITFIQLETALEGKERYEIILLSEGLVEESEEPQEIVSMEEPLAEETVEIEPIEIVKPAPPVAENRNRRKKQKTKTEPGA